VVSKHAGTGRSVCNNKLRYREEHSASIVIYGYVLPGVCLFVCLSWPPMHRKLDQTLVYFMTFIERQLTNQPLIDHFYVIGHESY